jgi:transposase InsO family protein
MIAVFLSVFQTLRSGARSRAALQLEILALRHQLQVLQRTRARRIRIATVDRWLWVLLSRIWTGWRTSLVIVKPETASCAEIRPMRMRLEIKPTSTRRRHSPWLPRDANDASIVLGAEASATSSFWQMDSPARPLAFLLLVFSGWINRRQQDVISYLLEENRVLRAAHGSHRIRLTDDQRRRLAVKGKALGRRRLADVAGIVTPDTILRWYRCLIANKYEGSKKRGVGRPSTKPDIVSRVVRMAQENPTWGYTRIRGGLHHLGHDIARSTIKSILQNHGIEPAPQRRTTTPWKTFLAAHWDGLAAANFFTVEVLTWRGLVRYVVFFVMKLKTRTVKIAGITSQANEHWLNQMARNLTDPHDGFLNDVRYLIVDRDPLYTTSARNLLRDSGVTLLRLPARSPNLNAFAERFVESIRAECLARIVPLGERHLRTAVRTFVEHYHEERPHQGLSNALIAPRTQPLGEGSLRCRQRLGGMLRFYYRAAA